MTKNNEPSLDNVLKLTYCSLDKCKKELEKIDTLKYESYMKLAVLFNKAELTKMPKDKYQKETKKIVNEINNHKDNIKFIKCKIKNCNDNIRNVLLITISNALNIRKDKKSKVMLNHYQNLFKQPIIKYKDAIKFYNDLDLIS
jgi:hypothetical protein